jgi:hypothetical protein
MLFFEIHSTSLWHMLWCVRSYKKKLDLRVPYTSSLRYAVLRYLPEMLLDEQCPHWQHFVSLQNKLVVLENDSRKDTNVIFMVYSSSFFKSTQAQHIHIIFRIHSSRYILITANFAPRISARLRSYGMCATATIVITPSSCMLPIICGSYFVQRDREVLCTAMELAIRNREHSARDLRLCFAFGHRCLCGGVGVGVG